MKFDASRAAALNKLNNFVEENLSEYSKLRNFDFGPEKRANVSCLSPYITHGVITVSYTHLTLPTIFRV